ncbi:hypothetical protein EHI8A_062170 [Entamoeba histolytica HM-1:IMSS-B]|uniref:Rap-GAP domain-containing protein n=5 Tax=Entamoeba histolytica TaxID=5759 RepID=A0A175JH93_ENTHI|nr:Hypothetical protein EHI5A_094830 [Entamoeba histolytica KU27]EMH73046.1 hypothetical protein EHI8A_062170 [Entamoeba histolytica HM-1:IMSS-B]EMS14458.1 hypothetical protein KM1_114580 [Entamoeba histolytica HM-3:IMSS]ENY62927.1 hypothetical protein EHI7A_059730 [Entamoeba histolytica HM-1:IMSS-A]GAT92834.1 hypothetical protein CL6EHI_125900 [Entamoeba histolytica]
MDSSQDSPPVSLSTVLKEYPPNPLLIFKPKQRLDIIAHTVNRMFEEPDIENKIDSPQRLKWFLEILGASYLLDKGASAFALSTLKLFQRWLQTDNKPAPMKTNFNKYSDYILYSISMLFDFKTNPDVQISIQYFGIDIIASTARIVTDEATKRSCVRSLMIIADHVCDYCPYEGMTYRVFNALHECVLHTEPNAILDIFFLHCKKWGLNPNAATQWCATAVAIQTGYVNYLIEEQKTVKVTHLLCNGESDIIELSPERALQFWLDFLKVADIKTDSCDLVSLYVEGFSALMHLLADVHVESKSPHRPDGNSIFKLYGNYLFSVIIRLDHTRYSKAVAEAIAALINFFATMIRRTTFEEKYIYYLTIALNRTLTSPNNTVVYSCISNISKLLNYPVGSIALCLEPLLSSIIKLLTSKFPVTPTIYHVFITALHESLLPFTFVEKEKFIPIYNKIILILVKLDLLSPENFPLLFDFIGTYFSFVLPVDKTSVDFDVVAIRIDNTIDKKSIHHIVWAILYESSVQLPAALTNSKERIIKAIVNVFRVIKEYICTIYKKNEFIIQTTKMLIAFLNSVAKQDNPISISLIVESMHICTSYIVLVDDIKIATAFMKTMVLLYNLQTVNLKKYATFFIKLYLNSLTKKETSDENEMVRLLKENGIQNPMKYIHVCMLNDSFMTIIDLPYKTDALHTIVILRDSYGKRVYSFKTNNTLHCSKFENTPYCDKPYSIIHKWIIDKASSSFYEYSPELSLENIIKKEASVIIPSDYSTSISMPTSIPKRILPSAINPLIGGRILHGNLSAFGTKVFLQTTEQLIKDLTHLDQIPSKTRIYIYIQCNTTKDEFFLSFMKSLGQYRIFDNSPVFVRSDFRTEFIFDCPQLTQSTPRELYDYYLYWNKKDEQIEKLETNSIVIQPRIAGSFTITHSFSSQLQTFIIPSYSLSYCIYAMLILPKLRDPDAFLQSVDNREKEINRICKNNREMVLLEWILFLDPVVNKTTKFNWNPAIVKKERTIPSLRKSSDSLPKCLETKVEQRRSKSKMEQFIENNEDMASLLISPDDSHGSRQGSVVEVPDSLSNSKNKSPSSKSPSCKSPLLTTSPTYETEVKFFSKPDVTKQRKVAIGSMRKSMVLLPPAATSCPPEQARQPLPSVGRKTFAIGSQSDNNITEHSKDTVKIKHPSSFDPSAILKQAQQVRKIEKGCDEAKTVSASLQQRQIQQPNNTEPKHEPRLPPQQSKTLQQNKTTHGFVARSPSMIGTNPKTRQTFTNSRKATVHFKHDNDSSPRNEQT